MKWFNFLFLLFLAGISCAQSFLSAEKVITYDYSTTIASGILQPSSQYSVVTLEGKLKVTTHSNEYVYFKLEDVKIGEKNEELPEINLSKIKMRTERNNELAKAFSEPFGAKFEAGLATRVFFGKKGEESWVKDLKKGIIDIFGVPVARVPTFKAETEGRAYTSRAIETSVLGECEVQTVVENLPHPSNSKIMVTNITRRINSDNCVQPAEFSLSNHPAIRSSQENVDQIRPVSHNIVTKLEIARKEGEGTVIERIRREGFVKVSLMGQKGDSLVSIYDQQAVLREISSQASQGPMLQETEEESLISDMRNNMEKVYAPTRSDELLSEEVSNQINTELRRLLNEIADNTINRKDTDRVKKILSNEILIQKALRSLPLKQINRVVEEHLRAESEKDQIKKKALLDILARTGTKDAIDAISELITKNKISDIERILSLLRNIPTHVLIPDLDIADIVLNTCTRSRKIRESNTLLKNCYFSFASLVSRSCIHNKPNQSGRPVQSEKRCSKSKLKTYVTELKRLMDEYRDHENEEMEIAIASAVGLMGVKESIGALKGRAMGEETESKLVQLASIDAMELLAKINPDQVNEIMSAIVYDNRKESETRIAAAAVILSSVPQKEILDKLAHYTQTVKDQQLRAFIISSLHAISKTKVSSLNTLAKAAKHSLRLAKLDVEDSAQMGSQVIVNNLISSLEAGYVGSLSFVGDSGSFIPSDLRMTLDNYASGFINNIFAFRLHGLGLKEALNKLVGPGGIHSQESIMATLKRLGQQRSNRGSSNMGEMPQEGIWDNSEESPRLLMVLRTLHHKFLQGYFNVSEIAQLLDNDINLKDLMDSSGSIDLVRYQMPLDIKHVILSGAGHHVHLDVKMPMMIALKAKYSAKTSQGSYQDERKIEAQLEMEPMLSGKLNVKLGPVLPCSQSSCEESKNRLPGSPTWGVHYAVGYETTVVFRPSVSVKIEGDSDNFRKFIKVSLTPSTSDERKSNEIVYYESKPFSTIYSRSSLKRLAEFSKPIRIMEKPHKVNHELSITSSSDLVLKGYHEDEWLNQQGVISAVNERKLGGILNFPLLTQTLRMREFKIELSPKVASSKYNMKLRWTLMSAASGIQEQPKTLRESIWKALTGWYEVPEECSDLDPLADPWERMAKSQHLESYRTSTNRPSYGSFYGSSSRESSEERQTQNEPRSRESDSSEEQGNLRMWMKSENAGGKLNRKRASLKNEESVFIVDASLEVTGGKNAMYKFNSTWRKIKSHDRVMIEDNLDIDFLKADNDGQQQGKVKGSFSSPKRPCNLGGIISDETEKEKKAKFIISWGTGGDAMEFQINMKKSESQKEFDRLPATDSRKPWFYKRCEEERKKGFLYHESCQRVMDHKSELHQFQIALDLAVMSESSPLIALPIRVQKALIHMLYNHMSTSFRNTQPHNGIVINGLFNDERPALDLEVITPRETTLFKNVRYDKALPVLSPPSTRKSMIRSALDHATRNLYPNNCVASGIHLTSFDNITMDLLVDGNCPYVIAKDCGSRKDFEILLHNTDKSISNEKTLIVNFFDHTIMINPKEANNKGDLIIDGDQIKLEDKSIEYIEDTTTSASVTMMAMIVKRLPIYNVVLPSLGVRVKFDGRNFKIEASDYWRKRVCGLCGSFRGQKQYNRIGADRCAYATDSDLVSHYMQREGSTCKAPSKPTTKMCGSQLNGLGKSNMHDGSQNCFFNGFYLQQVGRKFCMTNQAHPKCSESCNAGSTEVREVKANCIEPSDRLALKAKENIENGQDPDNLLAQFRAESTSEEVIEITVPTNCVPNKQQ